MKEKLHIQFSPTRLKQMKKIAFSGSRAKLKILNGKLTEGFQILKNTAQKFKSFATDLADKIPQALAARISLDLFSHFESKSSKRLGIPKGMVLGGVLAVMASLPATGQTFTNVADETALITAINTANGDVTQDHTIRLEQGSPSTIYTLTGNLPTITNATRSIFIICTGTTNAIIDGDNLFRPLTMAINSDLILDKITVRNGSAANGGGISNTGGNLTISNSLVTSNETTNRGAGMYSTGATASILIQNSTLSLNSSSQSGSAIHNRDGSTLTISSSTISGNTTAVSGGAIYNTNSSLTISSSTLSNNKSGTQGGAIAAANSTNTSISNVYFSGNTSGSDGGAIFNANNSMTLSSSSFTGNTANNGGAIFNHSNASLAISNSMISGSIATTNGGAIFNQINSPLTISSSTISENMATSGGGIFSQTNSSLTISNSIISLNSASTNGGGILNQSNSPLAISSSTISGNTTAIAGGGINNNGSTMTISNSIILNNIAVLAGGIFSQTNSSLTIVSSTISNNMATGHVGGGIASQSNSPLTIFDCMFSENSGLLGGAVFTDTNSPLIISSSTLIGNTATTSGGGVYARNGSASITSSTISDNNGGFRGGGIAHRNGVFLLASSTVSGNISTQIGGGIMIQYNAAVGASIIGSSISNNSVSGFGLGGGAFIKNSDLNIQGSSITLNTATVKGGGIYIASDGTDAVSIVNTTISSNTAIGNTGGGIYATSTGAGNTLTLQHVTLFDNDGVGTDGFANAGAGAMDVTVQNTIIDDCLPTGLDFSLAGGATLNGGSSDNIVEDGSMAGASAVHSKLNGLTLNAGFLINTVPTDSPAINGAANIGIGTDQLGNARGGTTTIGAVETTAPAVACIVVTAPAGITTTWLGCVDTDWANPANWSTNCPPKVKDVVYVPIGTANELIIDEVATCAKMVVQIGAKCLVNYNAGGQLRIKF
jgi:hypothetical protein